MEVNKKKTEKEIKKEEENHRDKELVRHFKTGDEDAFSKIVTLYKDKLYNVANSLLHNHHDSEEMVQDAFVRAHRGLADFRGDSSLYTWLHHIVVNLSRNRYWYFFRRRKDKHISIDKPLTDDTNRTFADVVADDNVELSGDAADMNEFKDHITVAMESLSPLHREILTLRNMQNKSYEEIAEILGISVGTVKSRIARAREELRKELIKKFPDLKQKTKKRNI
ncbi:sigma-70 family RNA polymerase sigma factor [Candidatus Nomurabacteria bacterium]|nr:sigma-70 family RNA polymerase sigma factor [Candidatus Nomurabacteria bacterium]